MTKINRLFAIVMVTLLSCSVLLISCNHGQEPNKPMVVTNADEVYFTKQGSNEKLTALELKVGEKVQIAVTVKPTEVSITNIESVNKTIATYINNTVTAINAGETTIIATAGENKKTAELKIVVKESDTPKPQFEYDLLKGADNIIVPKDMDDLKNIGPNDFIVIAEKYGWKKFIANGKNIWDENINEQYSLMRAWSQKPKSSNDCFFGYADYYWNPQEGPIRVHLEALWTWKPKQGLQTFNEQWIEVLLGSILSPEKGNYMSSLKSLGYTEYKNGKLSEDKLSVTVSLFSKTSSNVIELYMFALKDEKGNVVYVDENGKEVDKTEPGARFRYTIWMDIYKASDSQKAGISHSLNSVCCSSIPAVTEYRR